MDAQDVRCVLIVGSGTMGQEIGLQCAMHGYNVVLYDISPNILETAMSRLEEYVSQFIAEGRLTREEADATLARLSTTTNPDEAATGADLISESVPEDPKLKRKVFAQFNELCPPQQFSLQTPRRLCRLCWQKPQGDRLNLLHSTSTCMSGNPT